MSDDVRWRPGRALYAVAALFVVALIAIVVWDARLQSSGQDSLRRLAAERASAKDRISQLEADLDKANEQSKVAEKRARAVERRVGPVLRQFRAADARRDRVATEVRSLRTAFDDWVTVPDIGLETDTVAQSEIESAGLAWQTESVEGTCADYQDHFVDRGYGWSDVVKQDPAPGSRMAPGGTVTIYIWDYYSGWEYDCLGDA